MIVKRFVLRVTDEAQTLLLPPMAELMTARVEGSQLALYVLTGFVQPEQVRGVRVVGTDEEFDFFPNKWVATVTHKGAAYHVFEM